ncbi:hypothetical protein FJZ31_29415 [Candidatus Poribacteria bacterium]|nr:hypothetical protein [Candidatus Poribacteria bacterium]
MLKNKKDFIPETFASYEEAAEFWDEHDLTDYEDMLKRGEFEVEITKYPQSVELDEDIAQKFYEVAKWKDILVQILVNQWIRERLREIVT